MDSHIRRYVSMLPHEEMRQMLVDFEEFEQTGVTGHTMLRKHVEHLMGLTRASSMFGFWCQLVVLEIWRRFATIIDPTLGMTSQPDD